MNRRTLLLCGAALRYLGIRHTTYRFKGLRGWPDRVLFHRTEKDQEVTIKLVLGEGRTGPLINPSAHYRADALYGRRGPGDTLAPGLQP